MGVRTEAAVVINLRTELSVGDSTGCRFNPDTGLVQLTFASQSNDRDVLLEVMKSQGTHSVSPLLSSRDCINGELQTLIGFFLGTGLAGLVIHDGHTTISRGIDSIDPASDRGLADLNLEPFLGVKNLGCGARSRAREKILQLLYALPLVQIMLVFVRNFLARQIISEQLQEFLVALGPAETYCVVIGAQHTVHRRPVPHGSGDLA